MATDVKDDVESALREERIRQQVFEVLANVTRRSILKALACSQPSGIRLASLPETLGLSRQILDHHLSLLRMAGLVEWQRDGLEKIYRLLPEALDPAHDFIQGLKTDFRGQRPQPEEIRP